jgi:ribonuclease J
LEERLPKDIIQLKPIKQGDKISAGSLEVEFIRVTHSIPETCAVAVHTVHGHVLFTADFKFDFAPVDGKLTNINRLAELGKEGVVVLLSDSTNVDRPGWGPSESSVSAGLRAVMSQAEGRVLLTTFASSLHRMQQFCEVASELGRKVAVVGRRMEQNLDISQRMGYIKIPEGTLIALDEMGLYPDCQLAVLTTGSQGEPMSALVQMSKGQYGRMQVKEGDTLIYSARPIPGNEGAIWRTINRLFDQGCTVVYDSRTPIHVSGHAYQEELKMMISLTRPFYVAPVHGEPRHQFLYNQIAAEMGYPEHRRFTLKAGVPMVITETSAEYGEEVPCGRVLVDNGGGPGVSDEVLRDRSNLAQGGLVVVTVAVDEEHGEIVGDPVVQSKGLHGPDGVLDYVVDILQDALNAMTKEEIRDLSRLRHQISDVARRAILRKAGLRPLLLPIVVEV